MLPHLPVAEGSPRNRRRWSNSLSLPHRTFWAQRIGNLDGKEKSYSPLFLHVPARNGSLQWPIIGYHSLIKITESWQALILTFQHDSSVLSFTLTSIRKSRKGSTTEPNLSLPCFCYGFLNKFNWIGWVSLTFWILQPARLLNQCSCFG